MFYICLTQVEYVRCGNVLIKIEADKGLISTNEGVEINSTYQSETCTGNVNTIVYQSDSLSSYCHTSAVFHTKVKKSKITILDLLYRIMVHYSFCVLDMYKRVQIVTIIDKLCRL